MNTAYILLGGNIGNRIENLTKAKLLIQKHCGEIAIQSSIYQTAAWGLKDQPDFYNQVISIQTNLSPEILMQTLLHIEAAMGRTRTVKMGPRIIDLDILLIDDLIIETETLFIPHPAMTQRKFALEPLNEIASTLMHPVEKKPIHQLLQYCTDKLNVQKINL